MRIFSHKNDSGSSLSDECLSDLQLTALLEGDIKAKEKKSFIRHINRCSDCRFSWMEASSYIISPVPPQAKKLSLSGCLRPFNGFLTPINAVSSLAVITILVVLTFIQQPIQQDMNVMLNQHYAQLNDLKYMTNTRQTIENMPLPWEHGVLGFSSTYPETSSLAFAAGLWNGRSTLSKLQNTPPPESLLQTQDGGWNKSEQRLHYQLGRWFSLLWYAAQINDNFDSTQQFKILEKFNLELQTKNSTDIKASKALNSITRLSLILKDFEQKKISNDQLREQLEIIMVILSPVSLEQPS